MFKIKWRNVTGQWSFARDRTGKVCQFAKRQQCRQYVRNQRLQHEDELTIVYPNGECELYEDHDH